MPLQLKGFHHTPACGRRQWRGESAIRIAPSPPRLVAIRLTPDARRSKDVLRKFGEHFSGRRDLLSPHQPLGEIRNGPINNIQAGPSPPSLV